MWWKHVLAFGAGVMAGLVCIVLGMWVFWAVA